MLMMFSQLTRVYYCQKTGVCILIKQCVGPSFRVHAHPHTQRHKDTKTQRHKDTNTQTRHFVPYRSSACVSQYAEEVLPGFYLNYTFHVGRCGSGGRAVVWQSEGCRFDPTLGVSKCP